MVCNALNISNTTQAMQRLNKNEQSMHNIGRAGKVNIMNEPGVYNLVFSSRKPEVKKFKRWIRHEVLPDIRKHGMYATKDTVEKMLKDLDAAIEMLENYKEVKEENETLQKHKGILDKSKKSEVKDFENRDEGVFLGEFAEWVNKDLDEHSLTKEQIIKALTGKFFKKTAFGQPYKQYRGKLFLWMAEDDEYPLIKGKYVNGFLKKLSTSCGNRYDPENDYYEAILELYDNLNE